MILRSALRVEFRFGIDWAESVFKAHDLAIFLTNFNFLRHAGPRLDTKGNFSVVRVSLRDCTLIVTRCGTLAILNKCCHSISKSSIAMKFLNYLEENFNIIRKMLLHDASLRIVELHLLLPRLLITITVHANSLFKKSINDLLP